MAEQYRVSPSGQVTPGGGGGGDGGGGGGGGKGAQAGTSSPDSPEGDKKKAKKGIQCRISSRYAENIVFFKKSL